MHFKPTSRIHNIKNIQRKCAQREKKYFVWAQYFLPLPLSQAILSKPCRTYINIHMLVYIYIQYECVLYMSNVYIYIAYLNGYALEMSLDILCLTQALLSSYLHNFLSTFYTSIKCAYNVKVPEVPTPPPFSLIIFRCFRMKQN